MNGRLIGAVGLALLCAAIPTQANFIPGDGVQVVRIQASDGDDTGSLVFIVLPGGPSELSLPPGVGAIRGSSGEVLGKLNGLELSNGADPSVILGFNVTAGGSLTTFTIDAALVSFTAIVNPLAFATAGITLTDNDSDGANLTGKYTGNQAYQARYNAGPAIVFTEIVSSLAAAADTTAVLADRDPATGDVVIPATVSSIESSFSFDLTPNDSASGTSRFSVIPEPATLLLLGLGCVPLMRRRR